MSGSGPGECPPVDARTRIWVEIAPLCIPGWKDLSDELRDIARFIRGVDHGLPRYVTVFHPTYKMLDRQPTPPHLLQQAAVPLAARRQRGFG